MSPLHQDRLPAECSKPDLRASTNLPMARGASSRVVDPPEAESAGELSTQRQGNARRTGTLRSAEGAEKTRSLSTLASRAEAATGKAATGKAATGKAATGKAATGKAATGKAATGKAATLKAATSKVATARAASVKAATAKAATAARAAAVTTVANRTAGVRSARAAAAEGRPVGGKTAGKAVEAPAASKPAASEPATSKPATSKPATSKASVSKAPASDAVGAELSPARPAVAATTPRPTPHKRVPVVRESPAEVVPPIDPPIDPPVDVAAAKPTAGGRPALFRRRPSRIGRRSALCLTAAAAGAIALSAFSVEEPAAQPAAESRSVSVAEQLGIEAESTAVLAGDATERLGELTASRNVRDAEQAAAAQVQLEADRVAAEAAAAAAAEAARPKAVIPVEGARLTSGFGARWGTLHAGVDLAAPMHTPEYAVMDGVVLEAGPASGFGLAVYIQHENGDVTVYGHMDEILVEAGQIVRAGDTIALLGNRGQSTGPHLHFEVHAGGLDGEKIDPLPWLRSNGVDI